MTEYVLRNVEQQVLFERKKSFSKDVLFSKEKRHCFQSTNFLVRQFGGSCFYHGDKIKMQITSSEEGNFP